MDNLQESTIFDQSEREDKLDTRQKTLFTRLNTIRLVSVIFDIKSTLEKLSH